MLNSFVYMFYVHGASSTILIYFVFYYIHFFFSFWFPRTYSQFCALAICAIFLHSHFSYKNLHNQVTFCTCRREIESFLNLLITFLTPLFRIYIIELKKIQFLFSTIKTKRKFFLHNFAIKCDSMKNLSILFGRQKKSKKKNLKVRLKNTSTCHDRLLVSERVSRRRRM